MLVETGRECWVEGRGAHPWRAGGEGLVGRAGLQLYTSATTQYPVLVPSHGDGLVRWALA